MFNGIIKNIGRIKKITKTNSSFILEIQSNFKFKKNDLGCSISCSGACLTLKNFSGDTSKYFLSKETLKSTNFKILKKGDLVNLEKSLKHGDRLSGHFVQGHVDITSKLNKINFIGKSCFIDFKLPNKYKKYIVKKGSIAINGISLTISKILRYGFQIVVIPQTFKFTNLMYLKKNDVVNIEFDILGKYINNFIKKKNEILKN